MLCLQCGSEMTEHEKGWGCPKCDNFHIKDEHDLIIKMIECNRFSIEILEKKTDTIFGMIRRKK